MGSLQLLASLWPFLKEMFVGEKINDPSASNQGPSERSRNSSHKNYPKLIARWLITKMQGSRKFLATVITLLLLSLFVNYKVITKISPATLPRDEEQTHEGTPDPKENAPVPTVPSQNKSEKDLLFEQTKKELQHLYGVKE